MTLTDISNKVKEIRNSSNFIYDYVYYTLEGNNLIINENLNKSYGKTREGYETFKQKEPYSIGYSGIISARTIELDNDLVGYIFEKKLYDKSPNNQIINLHKEAFDILLKELEVKNIERFETFLAPYIDECLDKDLFVYYSQKIEKYKFIIKLYNKDEDFRELVNLIK
jgi:hypothetical protein